MLAKIEKWLTKIVIKLHTGTELVSEESQVKALRRYLEMVNVSSVVKASRSLPSTVTLVTQFSDIEKLHKKLVEIRQSLDNNESLQNTYNSAGKTKLLTRDFLTTSNGVYVKPENYLPNIIKELSTVLTHADKLRSKDGNGGQYQNEYILRFVVSDMIEIVKHLIEISESNN